MLTEKGYKVEDGLDSWPGSEDEEEGEFEQFRHIFSTYNEKLSFFVQLFNVDIFLY